jgi:copper chaperone NosL
MKAMTWRSRALLVLAALMLVPAFSLPLWSIRLIAPQYREGLGMYIGTRDIWGHSPHDLQNINILNHYIGMKPIVPAEVDVLQVMPWALLALAVAAVVAGLIGRRWAVYGWLAAFVVLGVAGLYEFHSWNYDYGHNLSPDAPIKVPGMTYQPPLIGTTTLLTIRASSYPSWGTLFVALAFLAGLWAVAGGAITAAVRRLRDRFSGTGASGSSAGGSSASGTSASGLSATRVDTLARREQASGGTMTAAAGALLALLLVVTVAACGAPAGAADSALARAEAPAFAPGGVPCDYCDGVIPEQRFGAELVTRAGTTYRFMSVECLAGFVAAGRVAESDIRTMQVVDYAHGERLVDATSALYVRSEQRKSPSGLNILATDVELVAHNLHFFFGGTRMSWAEVLDLVRAEWSL